jgi:hypothetical protein
MHDVKKMRAKKKNIIATVVAFSALSVFALSAPHVLASGFNDPWAATSGEDRSGVVIEGANQDILREALNSPGQFVMPIEIAPSMIGPWKAEMLISRDGTASSIKASIPLSAKFVPRRADYKDGALRTEDREVEFIGDEDQIQPDLYEEQLLLRNASLLPLMVRNFHLENEAKTGISYRHDCSRVEPSESCRLTIMWRPQEPGDLETFLNVSHTGQVGILPLRVRTKTTPLMVNPEYAKDDLLFLVDSIDFGGRVDGITRFVTYLLNTGDEDVRLDAVHFEKRTTGLSMLNSICKAGVVLPPGESCMIEVEWVPSALGQIDNRVVVTSLDNIRYIPVMGNALVSVVDTDGHDSTLQTLQVRPTRDTLKDYFISSFSRDRAMLSSPDGYTLVHNGQGARLAGFRWDVKIRSDAVRMIYDDIEISLPFERSLKTKGRTKALDYNEE